VNAFVTAWDRLDLAGVKALLAPAVRFANGPLPVLTGRDTVMAYLHCAGPFDACRWEILSLAVAGCQVLTERIDHLVVRGTSIALPIMGVFDVQDGLIAEWRDYFDLASYRAQLPTRGADEAGA
jgi:limonene-1,2-epoxide hydrolase